MTRPIAAILVAAGLFLAACVPSAPITYDGKTFVAHGWKGADPADWSEVFAVYASEDPSAPALAGTYLRRGGEIRFTPVFPPRDVSLKAVYRQGDGTTASAVFEGPKSAVPAETTKIETIYPSTQAWPANMLRFYVHFSQPMRRGVAWEHLRLEDEQGRAIRLPFVEIDQELWSPDMTRLTILFDPGRIKRGLTDNMNAGPPLVPGRSYTLVVDKSWPDAWGRPLAADFRKPITAAPDVRLPIEPNTWRISAPTGPRDPVVVTFPRPLDHALALRVITVPDTPGETRLEADDTRWTYTPDRPWTPGRHEIRIDGVIEDSSGNRLHRLFDVDVTSDNQDMRIVPFETLGFTVRE